MSLVAQVHATDVAVFFALDADLKALAAAANSAGNPVVIGSRTVHRLELGGHRVYAVKMGRGLVETAISTATLLTRFRCALAFSLGPVGALDDTLTIGQWYEVGQVVPYQKGTWDAGGFQMATPANEAAREARQEPSLVKVKPGTLFAQAPKITVASGEVFVTSSNYRTELRGASHAAAVDMNLFGLQTACSDRQVPLFSWRIVSDRADDEAGEQFRAFVSRYDGAGGKALAAIIRELPADAASPEAYPEIKRLLEKRSPSSP